MAEALRAEALEGSATTEAGAVKSDHLDLGVRPGILVE
jgi:hypothetical protein